MTNDNAEQIRARVAAEAARTLRIARYNLRLEQAAEQALDITFTGTVRIYEGHVWFEYLTPSTWEGVTFMRIDETGQILGKLADDFDPEPVDAGHDRDYPITD